MGAVCCKCKKHDNGLIVINELSQKNNQSSNRSSLIISSTIQISTIQNAMEMSSQTSIFADEGELQNKSEEVAISKEEDIKTIKEKIVCNETELNDNEMKEIDFVDGVKILLIKQNGKFYAITSDCGHKSSPVSWKFGTLGNGTVRCPQHGEILNLETGQLENFLSREEVKSFDVKVENGSVKVTSVHKNFHHQVSHVDNTQKFIIIGGGPSGQMCAETLRQNGFKGRIILICKESSLPYDKSLLSKCLNSKANDIQLRTQRFYADNSIDVMLNTEVIQVQTANRKLMLSSGMEVEYHKLYIATGSRPHKPKIPGVTLENIFVLQTFDDAVNINVKLKPNKHVVVYGGNVLGMEIAAYCADKVSKITIIDRHSLPMIETFGRMISERIMELFKAKNVHFIMESEIRGFVSINQEQYLSAIKLSNGDFLRADICILALDNKLNTKFLRNTEISLNSDGSIDTNCYLETNIKDIYVGGDIAANVPDLMSHENNGVAQYHGKIAALNMIGKPNKALTIPFLQATFFGHHLTYVGYKRATNIHIDGSLKDLKFSAYFFDDDNNVVGVCATQPNNVTSDYAEKITQGHKNLKRENVHKHFGINIESTEPFIKEEGALNEDMIEEYVCDVADLTENEMKEFIIDKNKKILLIKQKGKFYAVGDKCGHYGASLVMGSLGQKRIRCSWHGACYNIETGDIEDFPGLDAIPCYKVIVAGRDVKIQAKKTKLNEQKIQMPMAQYNPKSGQIFTIIGGGPSGQTCAEALRQNGYKGRIIMICKENHLPYDRIKCSKFLDSKIEDVQLRPASFYDEHDIEVMQNVEATGVDGNIKEVSLSCGSKLKYDKLYIATGGRSRKPNISGINYKNIFTLRTIDDANSINAKLASSSNLVIYGSGFIALELAAYCVNRVSKITIVSQSSSPLEESFGEAIGDRIMSLCKSKNIEFIMETEIKEFLSNFDKIESIELSNGTRIWADICIIAIGSEYNTEFLLGSGIILNKDGSISTNCYLETNISDVYVGGDIACSPIFMYKDKCATVEHYAVAQYHGKIAALNMLGIKTRLKTVPYFFILLFDYCITYTGYGKEIFEVFIDGDLDELKFAAFYFDEHQNVLGMSSCQPDKGISDFAEKLVEGCNYTRNDIEWAIEFENEEMDSNNVEYI